MTYLLKLILAGVFIFALSVTPKHAAAQSYTSAPEQTGRFEKFVRHTDFYEAEFTVAGQELKGLYRFVHSYAGRFPTMLLKWNNTGEPGYVVIDIPYGENELMARLQNVIGQRRYDVILQERALVLFAQSNQSQEK